MLVLVVIVVILIVMICVVASGKCNVIRNGRFHS